MRTRESATERAALNWPAGLDDNIRRLLQHTLSVSVDAAHHQDVLDALAHKLLDQGRPLAQPGGLRNQAVQPDQDRRLSARGAPTGRETERKQPCRASQAGQVCPSQPAFERAVGLKRLRTAGRQDASAAMLDRQIADLEAKLSRSEGGGAMSTANPLCGL